MYTITIDDPNYEKNKHFYKDFNKLNMNWVLDEKNEEAYLQLCKLAVEDKKAWKEFRSIDPMTMIVENSPLHSGQEYMSYILENYPHIFHSESFKNRPNSDSVGNPQLFKIDGMLISPTTLRYIKTLGDLEKHFGDLSGKVITEIGGGYGGLSKIIHDFYSPKIYTFYDQGPVLNLQDKFVRHFHKRGERSGILSFIDGPSPSADVPDLLIAMYSWSELDEATQVKYMENVISKADNAYIMLNYDIPFSMKLIEDNFPKECISEHYILPPGVHEKYAPHNKYIIIKDAHTAKRINKKA